MLETNLAALEGARHARVYSSGLAATAAAASWLHAGDHVVLADDGYGGTQRYFRQVLAVHNAIELSFVDLTQLQALRDALRPNTKVRALAIVVQTTKVQNLRKPVPGTSIQSVPVYHTKTT